MIWIVGSKGMLGSETASFLKSRGYEVAETDREVDITRFEAVQKYLGHKDIQWIVNCAAYTAVDDAEENPELAARLNIEGPKNLARAASEAGARLIHFSTDYVFGESDYRAPIPEDAGPAPGCVYGSTKLDGELAVRRETDRHYIIRIAWLYGKNGKNFVHTMLRLLSERDELKVVEDQYGCPTWARDVAGLIAAVIERNGGDYGTYHFCGKGETHWYGFAMEIKRVAEELGLLDNPARISPCSSDEFPTKARRPDWSVLATDKVAQTFGFEIPSWKKSLRAFLTELTDDEGSSR